VFDYEAKLINLPERKKCKEENQDRPSFSRGAPTGFTIVREKIQKSLPHKKPGP
jgi:hypothetical protein